MVAADHLSPQFYWNNRRHPKSSWWPHQSVEEAVLPVEQLVHPISPLLTQPDDELVEHIREHGIENPLEVSPAGVFKSSGRDAYYVDDGNHRLVAAKQLGMTKVPVRIYRPKG